MELTNNPIEGTGLTVNEAAERIEKLLDSETGATTEVDADNETEEVSTTELEVEEIDTEQAEEASEEVEENPDTDMVEDETEEAEQESPSDDEIVFEVDGKQVTRKEAQLGYLRQSDYTKKTQELAAEKKAHLDRYKVEQVNFDELRTKVDAEILDIKKSIAREFSFEEPNWDDLLAYDPSEYTRQKHEWEQKQAKVRELYELERLSNEKKAQWQQEQIKLAQAQAYEELAAIHSEFADAQKAPALLSELGQYLLDSGFKREEIEGIADSRIMDVVYRLYKLEKVQQKVPEVIKKLEKKPALTMPGTTTSKQAVETQSYAKDRNRLKKSGSVNDAADFISKYIL